MKLLLLAMMTLPLAACSYDQALTPEQKTKVEDLDTQLTADKAKAAELERDAALALQKATQTQDAAELAKLQADLDRAREEYAVITKKIADATAERNKTLSDAVQQNTGGVISWALSLIPGIPQPLKEDLAAAAIPLLFKRPRQHAKKVAGSLVKLDLGSAIKSTATAVGLLHTEQPTQGTPTS